MIRYKEHGGIDFDVLTEEDIAILVSQANSVRNLPEFTEQEQIEDDAEGGYFDED